MKKVQTLLMTSALILLASCAKDRPIQEIVESGKVDVRLAKSNFNEGDQWYAKVTVVGRDDNGAETRLFVGNQSKLRVGYFKFEKDQLEFRNALSVYDPQEKQTEDGLLYAWGITHSDYHLKEVNGEVTNFEEENDYIPWQQKKYVRINFANRKVSPKHDIASTDSRCWTKVASTVDESSIKISPEHISFTVEEVFEYSTWYACRPLDKIFAMEPTYSVKLKYSFKPRKASNYTPYVYKGEHDPLINKYGYFKTKVTSYNNDGMLETKILMNRWDPKKQHTYFFAKGTPEKYKAVFNHPEKGVFARINQIMAQTGEPIRFRILDNPEDFGCEYGDVGCSFIRIIDEDNAGAPWGYGPSDADPETGEIIAGNAHVWAGKMKYYIDHFFKTKLEYERFAADVSPLFAKMKATLGENDIEKWTATAAPLKDYTGDTGDAYYFLLPQYTYTRRSYTYSTYAEDFLSEMDSFEGMIGDLQDKNIISSNFEEQFEKDSLGNLLELTDERFGIDVMSIKNQVAEEVESNLQYEVLDMPDHFFSSVREMVLSGKPLAEIFDAAFYHTSIHEVGHTLNLEHNFYGSVDQKNCRPEQLAFDINNNPIYERDANGNFVLDEKGDKVQAVHKEQSTSVMEYASLKNELTELMDYGPYDKAALIYAYSGGKVRDNTEFLFCTHNSVDQTALCNMHDYGTTPSEVVLGMIKEYEYSYPLSNYRNNRPFWDTSSYGYRRYALMRKMKTFLKMYYETFKLGDISKKLAMKDYKKPIEKIHQDIEADLKQAVKLTLAFYDAVIHQKNEDRDFRDTVNEDFGTIEKKGIWADKWAAMRMMLRNHYMAYSPNSGSTLTSYLTLLDDEDFKGMYSEILTRALTESVDEYADVDIYRMYMFAEAATDSASSIGQGEFPNIDLMGVRCYRENFFKNNFGHTLGDEQIKEITVNADAVPSYYAAAADDHGKVSLIALNRNGRVFVSSEKRNPLSHKLMKGLVGSESYLTYFRNGMRKINELNKFNNLFSGENMTYCQGID